MTEVIFASTVSTFVEMAYTFEHTAFLPLATLDASNYTTRPTSFSATFEYHAYADLSDIANSTDYTVIA